MDQSAKIAALELHIAELQRKLDFVMGHLGITYREPALPPGYAEAAAFLQQGNKIGAIKAYQERTGVGLKAAKDAVEALEKKLTNQ